jgi:hypothetical protein
MAFIGTVGALEACAFRDLVEGFLGNDVPAGHHHWGVGVGGLLFRDRADKDGVEVILAWKGYLDLSLRQFSIHGI